MLRALPRCPQSVLSLARMLLGLLLGTTVAYPDTTGVSSEHLTEGILGPPQGTGRAYLAGWGDTLLFAGTSVRTTGKSGVFWTQLCLAGEPVPALVLRCRSRAP